MAKGKAVSFQVYPGDWKKDPELSLCSPSTRGIWFDWICSMAEISAAGRPPILTGSATALARLARCSPEEALLALNELGENQAAEIQFQDRVTRICYGVTTCNFDVTTRISLSSRRMSREYDSRLGGASRVRRHREKKKMLKAGNEDVTPLLPHARVSSSSSSDSPPGNPLSLVSLSSKKDRGAEEGPPGGGRERDAPLGATPEPEGTRPKRRGRRPKAPDIPIPAALAEAGLTRKLFERRVLTVNGKAKTKPQWREELRAMAEALTTYGPDLLELYRGRVLQEGYRFLDWPKLVAMAGAVDAGGNGKPMTSAPQPDTAADWERRERASEQIRKTQADYDERQAKKAVASEAKRKAAKAAAKAAQK